MPRLDTETTPRPTVVSSLKSLVSLRPEQSRKESLKAVLLRSVRLRITKADRSLSSFGEDDLEERLDSVQRGQLPLRVRPAFVVLNVICLVVLGILGFHPRGQEYVPVNDKILHFICFLLATGLFYFIWDVDEPARRVWIWRHMALLLTWIVCFAAGGLGSEIVQSLLPYKTFQWLDVLANFMGSGVGLFFSYHAEKKYRIRREIERLYEPLDQEMYGDEDEENLEDDTFGDDNSDPWMSAGSVPVGGTKKEESGGRRVRFGPDEVLDPDEWHEEAQRRSGPTAAGSGSSEPAASGLESQYASKREDLFSIDDGEDDEADVWKITK